MTIRIGINGFGRIGRLVVRAIAERNIKDVEVVAINSPGAIETQAHLLRYDSVHGVFSKTVTFDAHKIIVDGKAIRVTHERNPAAIDWADLGVDVVMECTGIFRDKEGASKHILGGAKKVLISAPGDKIDRTIVYGVNHETLRASDTVVSCASCTTNCLAPVAKVLMDTCGIARGFMTTVHSYTQDQRILDNSHKDLYRARAAGLNMIPTSTGAAKAVGIVLPGLAGKLSGSAVRVPTANVSMVDLAIQPDRSTDAAEINAAMRAAADGPMKGVLRYTEQALVSSDLNHDPHSAIFAAPLTKVLHGDLAKIVAWYDNEWGFSNRMIDVARAMMQA
ncbi:type I glyceraldehyde-3-phosphate dehydrogenase [Robiginitomaculum antarcticum]|uniref:type I glyceraldehyde-3-phosphate dehydrogenase n=1 Tax=Robiginitomaculum antarcticum TaxID=437507 RepID=UPI000476BC82|nr:type I glyceraldehyde-3-phosphate dehydrogenase [Robiginitomaculum antarcticum]